MSVVIIGDVDESGLAPEWTNERIIVGVGDVKLDLSKRPPGPDATLSVFRLVGDVKVRVPRGARVAAGGFTLLGNRVIQAGGESGPLINLKVSGLVGDVEVTESETF
jgi:predicted membrane protein